MGRLQDLCGPGDHDKAKDDWTSEYVRHLLSRNVLQSCFPAETPEADAATKKDKGKGPMTDAFSPAFWYPPPGICLFCNQRRTSSAGPGSSPSLTSNTTMNTDTVMPRLPDIRAATPETSTSGGSSSAPPLPMLSNSGPSSSGSRSGSRSGSHPGSHPGSRPGSSFGTFKLVIRPHPRYATEPGTTPLPSQQPQKLCPTPEPTKSSAMCHKVFNAFGECNFTAVEVARHSRDGANEPVPLGGLPKCRCRIETVCYRPASGNGNEDIPPLPLSIPGRPMTSPREPGHHGIHLRDDAADTYIECAVHLYFCSLEGKVNDMRFWYRNDTMHFNQMMKLQLDVETLARRMAVALAIMHWFARIDARGVQFYLFSQWQRIQGRQLPQDGLQPGQSLASLAEGQTHLRVGHFKEAQIMEMNEDGVKMAVEAVKCSIYIPRPNQKLPAQRRTWDAFVSSYIAASEMILTHKGGNSSLPRLFIYKVITEERHWEIPY
ncbi:uncharacterized protein Triagg1_6334 [Trichoderma aggressivum f. europaeum]|uniref:DUF3669 domain-containing protein n=1 Tax=Trichoderma aggressivum f. europaeum TaxID=173218 RepID=A0AAE1IBE7_9HYPO|nr:hypothetical protein Triagg1_6334 [Trichoderma aggressivum f. europaeum]